ncbi:thiol-disulfide oxidoreductase DCC family protein [Colwelliaceae bacterium 6441]
MLTIFYDGNCPLCTTEMTYLKRHDKNNLINLINLHQPDFASSFPEIAFNEAMQILHGRYQGKLLLGLEVTHRAWTLVGKGFWVAPLNWSVIKTLSHWGYLGMAKYRHQISFILNKAFHLSATKCQSGVCYDKKTHDNNRCK